MRNNPSVAVIRQEFRVRGHPIGLEKAEEVRAVLEKAGTVTGLSPRDVLEITAINAKGGALDRLFIMVNIDDVMEAKSVGKRSIHGEG